MKRDQNLPNIKNYQYKEVANKDEAEKVDKPYRKRGNSYLQFVATISGNNNKISIFKLLKNVCIKNLSTFK